MPIKSSPHRYGAMAAAIHWLTALAVILLLVSGQIMGGPNMATILPVHVSLGIVVGVLTLFRIVWWLAFDKKPAPVGGTTKAQHLAAQIVHYGLYAAILIMVASGIAMVALSGAAPAIFGGGRLPNFSTLAPFGAHGLVSKLLLLLVIGHIGAALWHHLVKRDGLIGRMGFGG